MLCPGILLFAFLSAYGQRTSMTINNAWQFKKGELPFTSAMRDTSGWESVVLPHTWNVSDVIDDVPGYYRGTGWYKKTLYLAPTPEKESLYLHFEGVNQVARVYVNGSLAGSHTGGYTAFRVSISPYLVFKDSEVRSPQQILVRVTNVHDENIPPLSADFTFFGGIYRDVSLVSFPSVHFDTGETASSGVFITTPAVDSLRADVKISCKIANNGSQQARIIFRTILLDREGNSVARKKSRHVLPPGSTLSFEHSMPGVSDPILWSPDRPYLYSMVSEILETGSETMIDRVIEPVGFRFFRFDTEKGFFLNGAHLKLIGVNRHQDFRGFGNAVPDEVHLKDLRMMKEMGANFLRIAHYPQDAYILNLCDQMGILASVEIPIVNRITESKAFTANALCMQKEMIHQNFNHPSVIIWAYMNEVLLRPRFRDQPQRYARYVGNIRKLATEIESLTRKEDPYRYTLIPNHGSLSRYSDAGLTEIPMLVGWNLYQGWYEPDLEGFGRFLDRHHELLPHKPLLVTEYGGGADARIRAGDPERFDFSVEYNNHLHKTYLEAMLSRSFVAAAMVWNFADFNSEGRIDAVPNMNNKGLTEWNRKPKDAYYLYQAYLLKNPFVAIASREWKLREGIEDHYGEETCTQEVNVYANTDSVTLTANHQPCRIVSRDGSVATFSVPFRNGMNTLLASAYSDDTIVTDVTNIHFRILPFRLRDSDAFDRISISVGDKRTITDEETGLCWIPDQPYTPGGWGYMGGSVYVMDDTGRQSYGSDLPISGTPYDPVFQTQRYGIEEYRFDVPDGYYELVLHFADLEPPQRDKPLPYNLDTGDYSVTSTERAFSVFINERPFIERISNRAELLPGNAFSSKTNVYVNNGKGIRICFKPIIGETILNAIQVQKLL
jgi:beta-galactosidase